MKEFEPTTVQLIDIPVDIDLRRILLNKNQCQDNAYKVARDYDYGYVEGVAVLVDGDGGTKTVAHAWNESRAGHFDVTKSLWEGEEYREIKKIKYVPVLGYQYLEMPQGGAPFSAETFALVEYNNITRSWKFKPNDKVVLLDPATRKGVGHAEIVWFDSDTQIYEVKIKRLKNSVSYTWPEADIVSATVNLIQQAETLLATVEVATDLMVADYDTKGKPEGAIIEIPVDTPPYTTFYSQMDVGGQKKWRLLILKSKTVTQP